MKVWAHSEKTPVFFHAWKLRHKVHVYLEFKQITPDLFALSNGWATETVIMWLNQVRHILIFPYGLLMYCQITLKVLISIIKENK